MSELKPCPFCGGDGLDFDSYPSTQFWNDPEATVTHVWCECGGAGPVGPDREGAVSQWNTRTPPTLPRVKPEDLVDNEWYLVVNKNGDQCIGKAYWDMSGMPLGIWLNDVLWLGENLHAIFGPLPKFRLEGE